MSANEPTSFTLSKSKRSAPPRMDSLINTVNTQQQELQKLVSERQRLETQLHENKIVKSELDLLGADAKIYKMMGPVLMPQVKTEAESNIEKRLEFIKNSIETVEERMKSLQESLIKKQQELQAKMQSQHQAAQQQTETPA